MIEIKNISKTFGALEVLKDVSLTIPDGAIYGLVGASGAGKSTLLNCLTGLELYETGSIRVDGICLESLRAREARLFRKNIGMIFQNFSLVSRKTVYQNIALPMECFHVSQAAIKKRVGELAELVGLSDKLDVRPAQLSGGQKQRVAIARALTMNPRYILSDESTSALDPNITGSILALLKEIQQELGITIIMVTHEMEIVRQFCQQLAILTDGQVAATGTTAELFVQKPPSLCQLLGISRPVDRLQTGMTVTLQLPADTFLWHLGRQLSQPYRLLEADSFDCQERLSRSLTIQVADTDAAVCKAYLQAQQISYQIWRNQE